MIFRNAYESISLDIEVKLKINNFPGGSWIFLFRTAVGENPTFNVSVYRDCPINFTALTAFHSCCGYSIFLNY